MTMLPERQYQIARKAERWQHAKECPWITQKRFCYCHVVNQHKESLDTSKLYGLDGKVVKNLLDGSDLL